MNENSTSKSAVKAVWKSIKQMCGKTDSFIKSMWALIMMSFAVITLCGAALLANETIVFLSQERDDNEYIYEHDFNTHINGDIYCNRDNNNSYYIYNAKTNKKLIKNLDSVVDNSYFSNDSLAYFKRNGKYGYFNHYTGEVIIPEQFDDACQFNEGLAAVTLNNRLLFINKNAEIVIDKNFTINPDFNYANYNFINGLCIVPSNNKYGLIDKNGNWILNPEYDDIDYSSNYCLVTKDCMMGAYDCETSTMILPIKYYQIAYEDNYYEVFDTDNVQMHYDLQGNIIQDNVIDYVSQMPYDLPETVQGEDGLSYKQGVAKALLYRVDYSQGISYYGLMSCDGRCITKPIYSEIETIGQDLFLCKPDGVILNSRGERVE